MQEETAIVLTDESLLLPLLYAIPPEAGEINVTMGYPLRQTLAYSFVERLLRLQTHAGRKGRDIGFLSCRCDGYSVSPLCRGARTGAGRSATVKIVARSHIYVKAADLRRGVAGDRFHRTRGVA